MGLLARLPGSRVLIRPIDEASPSGLCIPESAQEKEPVILGEVIQVGSGSLTESGERIPVHVAPGERVLFLKFAGSRLRLDGEWYYVVNERDIIAVVS